MKARWIAAVAALVAGLALTGSASAQATTTYHYERRTEVQTAEVDHGRWARFRFGVAGHGGAMLNGPEIAFGGLSLRAGVQLSDLFGVYYQPMGLAGALYARPGAASGAGLLFNSAMADFTIADFVSLGFGPSLDFIWGCSDTYQTEADCDSTDPFFGANGRVALNLGAMGTGTRNALSISVDVHPTVFDWDRGTVGVTMVGGIGYEMM